MKSKLNNKFTYFNANTNANANVKKVLYILFIIIIIISIISIAFNIYSHSIFYNDVSGSDVSEDVLYKKNSPFSNIIETFDVEKYVDICKNRKTHFYHLTSSKLSTAFDVSNNSDCELMCSRGNCEIFLLKDISNSTMKQCRLFNDIEGSYDISLTLNCESNILPTNDYGAYNGYGFVNKYYFQDNSINFQYIDRYLEETEYIIDDLSYISYLNKKANSLDLTNLNSKNLYDYLEDRKISAYNNILTVINDVNSRLFNNSKNILFTDLLNHSFTHSEISSNILLTAPRDVSFIKLINDSINTNNNTEILNNKQSTLLTNYQSINSIYLILFIIMVLTIILLILYNIDIISEFILFSYFIFIILLILFINNIVKI
jgi:hypothetical protein